MPSPSAQRPRGLRATLVPFLLPLFVLGCGPSGVGTIKAGRDGSAPNMFPTPAGRVLKKAPLSSAPTILVPARRNSG